MADILHISTQPVIQEAASRQRPMRWVIVLSLIGLAGCAYTRPIYFRNDVAGKTIVCGPFTHRDVVAGKEQACIKKATEEGYVRYRN